MAKLTLSTLESTVGRALAAVDRDRAMGALMLAGLSPARGPGLLLTVRP